LPEPLTDKVNLDGNLVLIDHQDDSLEHQSQPADISEDDGLLYEFVLNNYGS